MQYLPQDEICKDCGDRHSIRHDTRQGRVVCTSCGVIQESCLVSNQAEWRNFSNDTTLKNRTGGSLHAYLPEHMQLSTQAYSSTGSRRRFPSNSASMQTRINKWNRNLSCIDELCSVLRLPGKISHRAKTLFSYIRQHNKRIYQYVQVCIVIVQQVAHHYGHFYTDKEIAMNTGISVVTLKRCRKRMTSLKQRPIPPPKNMHTAVQHFLDRFLSALHIRHWHTCMEQLQTAVISGVPEIHYKHPAVIAAALLYKVYRYKIEHKVKLKTKFTLGQLAKLAFASETSILVCMRIIPFLTQQDYQAEVLRQKTRRRFIRTTRASKKRKQCG